jgi:hypothetical protein
MKTAGDHLLTLQQQVETLGNENARLKQTLSEQKGAARSPETARPAEPKPAPASAPAPEKATAPPKKEAAAPQPETGEPAKTAQTPPRTAPEPSPSFHIQGDAPASQAQVEVSQTRPTLRPAD